MKALITNDDGVDSPGIHALARLAAEAGLDAVIAAPSWDSSGASASLTAVERDGRLLIDERHIGDVGDVRVFATEAAPAFIVRAAITGVFGAPPDIVLSGINRGPNTGHAVLHSGTVGAALTAATFGLPALAVSLDVRSSSAECHWETAEVVARVALRWLLDSGRQLVLNVNAPNCSPERLAGIRTARLAAFGAVQTVVSEQGAGYVKLAYEEIDADLMPGTDVAALAECVASVTSLQAVCEETGAALPDTFNIDLTRYGGPPVTP